MPPKKINQISGMPQMQAAIFGWTVNFDLVKITQTIENGFPVDAEEVTKYKGTIQPLSAEEINQKPEGQRAWKWLQIHVISGAQKLRPNDIIRYNGIQYKIMAEKDYSLNSFVEYHAIEDYQNG